MNYIVVFFLDVVIFYFSYCLLFIFFFFSSKRRHTRLQGDWSSDVCSSDLVFIRSASGHAAVPAGGCARLFLARTILRATAHAVASDPQLFRGPRDRAAPPRRTQAGRTPRLEGSGQGPLSPGLRPRQRQRPAHLPAPRWRHGDTAPAGRWPADPVLAPGRAVAAC